ncbi:MAG: GTP cyclohydrolase II [Hyphomicrobiaceae bacterium]
MMTMPRPVFDGAHARVSPFDGAASFMAARIASAAAEAPQFHADGQGAGATARGTAPFTDVARTRLPIEFQGREVMLEAHAYEDDSASYQAMAVVHRSNAIRAELPLVRMHSGCVTGDIFHSLRCDCYAQLQLSLERVVNAATGCIIYLPYHEGRGIGLVNKIKAYAEQDRGLDTVDANLSIGAPVDARDYELPAKILKDLGFLDIRLMTNNPLKLDALRAHGINVVEQVKTVTEPSPHNKRYLETKRERMAHRL